MVRLVSTATFRPSHSIWPSVGTMVLLLDGSLEPNAHIWREIGNLFWSKSICSNWAQIKKKSSKNTCVPSHMRNFYWAITNIVLQPRPIFSRRFNLDTYRAFHKLPQIYTANHATFPIQMYEIAVWICGNFWGTQYCAWLPIQSAYKEFRQGVGGKLKGLKVFLIILKKFVNLYIYNSSFAHFN